MKTKKITANNRLDLTGKKYGRLTAIKIIGKGTDNHIIWECVCDCGEITTGLSSSLKRGMKLSCGCLRKDAAKKRIKQNGIWNDGKSYAINNGERCYKTKHSWSKAVIRHYGNRCEKCGWDKARCDSHHREYKAKGGLHTIKNGIVLCPNCHRIIHAVS